jgi:hypothetical protein
MHQYLISIRPLDHFIVKPVLKGHILEKEKLALKDR